MKDFKQRMTQDQWAMNIALVTKLRSTCLRRGVGCVLTNAKGHILSTGVNGVASGLPHCNERKLSPAEGFIHPHACPGAYAQSGESLDSCHAIHAEQNALLQCKDIYQIHTCYVTTSPCVTCVKLLMNTSCIRIVYLEKYPQDETRKLWESKGLEWSQTNPPDKTIHLIG